MLAASSQSFKPAWMAAAMARVRPAAPRTSASGLAGSLRRAKYSALLAALVPNHARGWCSRRNRSGDKSRHPRAQTTPVEGSLHGPVGRRTGEPRRCRVVRGREDLPRETIRDLSTTPHQSMASTNQLPACSAWLQSAPPRLDRQARTASAALECGSAAAGQSKRVVPHCFPGGPLAP